MPVFLPGESQGQGTLVGCRLWGRTELDTTEATYQQQQARLRGLRSSAGDSESREFTPPESQLPCRDQITLLCLTTGSELATNQAGTDAQRGLYSE